MATSLVLISAFTMFILPTAEAAAQPIITPAPDVHNILARQGISGFTSCNNFYNILSACSAATPNIGNLPFSEGASCYCYSSSAFNPGPYDSAFNTCLEYLSTGDPAYYTSIVDIGLINDPCEALGNVISSSGSSGSQTVALTGNPNFIACSSWYAIQSSCAAATPSFTALVFSVEASCLCYTSSLFAPTIYDSLWGSCASFYETASPAFWSATVSPGYIASPCSLVGDVISVTKTTTLVAGPTGSTSIANVLTLPSPGEVTSFGNEPTQTGLTTTLATKTSAAAWSSSVGMGRFSWLLAFGVVLLLSSC